jgi:glucosamine--fructose-6-phosphate aminotransferase (isomerizing)
LGRLFEREIHAQPDVWDGVADSDRARRLAHAIDGDVLFVGSGSSLFVGELGAVALRRRGVRAQALAATEARLDCNAYAGSVVIALSQSGRSTDVLDALDALAPRRLVALTNTIDSPLGERADVTIDIGAGHELAVPASKSVTATAAIALWAASLVGGDHRRDGAMLHATARAVRAWLASDALADLERAGRALAARSNVVVLGSAYGLPIASEVALKLKEASYLHAEGFAAGEFRHGSVAMVDTTYAAIAIVDEVARETVARPMRELAACGALRYSIGGTRIATVEALGPVVDEPFNTLAWLVTAQLLALYAGRARDIDSDAPRGLTKALVGPGG